MIAEELAGSELKSLVLQMTHSPYQTAMQSREEQEKEQGWRISLGMSGGHSHDAVSTLVGSKGLTTAEPIRNECETVSSNASVGRYELS